MGEPTPSQVLLCWPADRKAMAELNKQLPLAQKFAPTTEHTLTICDSCGRQIWIAPQQLQLAKSPFIRAKKLCMFCVNEVTQALDLTPQQVDLNPELRFARRRTA